MSYDRTTGAEVYAASAIGSKIMPGWNVQRITPEGERGPLMPTPRRFAAPVGNGAVRPYKTLFGRAIGPQGPTGPVTALGDNGELPFTQLVFGLGLAALGAYILFRPLRTGE